MIAVVLSVGSAQPKPIAPPTAKTASVSYYKEIVPLFKTACVGCHNTENPAGGLNLTSYAVALKGGKGGGLLIPGKGAESRLVKYLTGELKPQMPPGSGLKQVDIDKVRRWVDGGAKQDTPVEEKITIKTTKAASPTKTSLVKSPVAIKQAVPANFALTKAAPVTSLAFSPDGKILAVGTYREVHFWSLEKKEIVQRWTGHQDTVRSLIYRKDGKLLAAGGGVSGSSGDVRLWEVEANREVRVFGDHTDSVNTLAFHPDGSKIVTASADKTIKVWNVADGKPIQTGRDHSDAVWGVAWSDDGKYIASCGADKSIKVWNPETLKRIYSVSGHEDVVYTIEFINESKMMLTSAGDRSSRTWNFGAEGSSQSRVLGGHNREVYAATYCAKNGMMATVSNDKTVKLWNRDGGNTHTLQDSKECVLSVRFNSEGTLVAAGTFDGFIFLWNTADGKLVEKLSVAPPYRISPEPPKK